MALTRWAPLGNRDSYLTDSLFGDNFVPPRLHVERLSVESSQASSRLTRNRAARRGQAHLRPRLIRRIGASAARALIRTTGYENKFALASIGRAN